MKYILMGLLNTNVFVSDKFSKIIFDRKFKIPSLYKNNTYDEKVAIFKKLINEEYKLEKSK